MYEYLLLLLFRLDTSVASFQICGQSGEKKIATIKDSGQLDHKGIKYMWDYKLGKIPEKFDHCDSLKTNP